MKNAWNDIPLNDYENHMQLNSVYQLQTLNQIMKAQLSDYPVSSVMIIGVASGNGLEHIHKEKYRHVYGIDINQDYLNVCTKRYPELSEIFSPVLCDLQEKNIILPSTEMIIANLLVEYIGYENFSRHIQNIQPQIVSCVIQINEGEGVVSDSPYLHTFEHLNEIHREITEKNLVYSMKQIGYQKSKREDLPLPNGKSLLRVDFE